jgi:hypothetical protein
MGCRNCIPEYAKGAQWCRYCGEDREQWGKRMRIVIYIVIVAVLILLGFFFLIAMPSL